MFLGKDIDYKCAEWVQLKSEHREACYNLVQQMFPGIPGDMIQDFLMEFSYYPDCSVENLAELFEQFIELNGKDGWKKVLNERFTALREMLNGTEVATNIPGIEQPIHFE
jgi:hypothetical protein